MQKKDYRQFNEENQSELQQYSQNIPIGQPISQQNFQQPLPPMQPMQQQPYINQMQYQYPQQVMYQPQMQPQMINPPPQMIYPPAAFTIQQPQNQMIQNYSFPIQIQCPCCKNHVHTIVNNESGNTTYLWCSFIMCCISPTCCCLPFLMDSCLDKSHYCPHCGHNILRKHQKCFEFMNC